MDGHGANIVNGEESALPTGRQVVNGKSLHEKINIEPDKRRCQQQRIKPVHKTTMPGH